MSIIFFLYDPPHSVCDSEIESYKKSLVGKVFSYSDKKNILPPHIKKMSEHCRDGKSPGSCLDYFETINFIMTNMDQIEVECMPRLIEEAQIIQNIRKFFAIMTVISWGDEVPKDSKTGWFSQSNILVYCKVKKFLEDYMDPTDFDNLKNSLISEFPFEKIDYSKTKNEDTGTNKAILKMTAEEVFQKSILSVRCVRYL